MYGPCDFEHAHWTSRLDHVAARLPGSLTEEFCSMVWSESPIPTRAGVSPEARGRRDRPAPDFNDPRQAFAFTQIANGTVLDAVYPSRDWPKVDPVRNISGSFPPTCIVHGTDDDLVPVGLSRGLYRELVARGIRCLMLEIPGEGHTFAATMAVDSTTWKIQRRGFDFLETFTKSPENSLN